jgi:voltage-gated potassium channel
VASPPPRKLPIPLRLLAFGSVPVFLIGFGTLGYRLLEGWSWFYSFYVSVITLTSIGYGERNPLSTSGRVFTMVLALGGISAVAVAATELLSTIITGELRDFWDKWRMGRRIEALDQHVIVCGYGHVGQHVCAELLGAGAAVVVIDRRDPALATASDAGALVVLGDASADATLSRAGIARARALVAVAGTDSENVLITMTARLLCPLLPIVSRAEEETAVPKLERAGATRTVTPDAIAGGLMAQAVLRPAVLDLIEDATGQGHAGSQKHVHMQMEEQLVHPGSPLDGKTVGTSGLRSRVGLILVAIKRRDGHMAFNPEDDAPVAAGDTLITLGSREQLGRADALALSR